MESRIFHRNANANMDVIAHQMPFRNFALFAIGKFINNGSQKISQASINDLLPLFGNKDNLKTQTSTKSLTTSTPIGWRSALPAMSS